MSIYDSTPTPQKSTGSTGSIYDVGPAAPAAAPAPAPAFKGVIPEAVDYLKNLWNGPVQQRDTPALSLYDQVNPTPQQQADKVLKAPIIQDFVHGAIEGWNAAAAQNSPKDLSALNINSPETASKFFSGLAKNYDSVFQSVGMAEHNFADHPNVATGVAALGEIGVQTLNAVFAPFSAAFSAMSSNPVIGPVADLINNFFAAAGNGLSQAAQKDFVQNLPISQQSKDTIAPVVGEIASLAGQIAAGKVGGDAVITLADKTKLLVARVHGDMGAQIHIMEKLPENAQQKQISPEARAPMSHEEYAKSMGYEPYTPADQLPVIQMGQKPKPTAKPDENLPVIQTEAPAMNLHQQLMEVYQNSGKGLLSHEVKETGVPNAGDHFPDFGSTASPEEQAQSRLSQQNDIVNSAPKVQRALDQVKMELQLAEPGYRMIGDPTHNGTETYGVPSTFPKWLPDNARSTEMIQKFLSNLDVNKIEYPPAKAPAQRAFYDAVWDQVDHYSGVDTKAIRARIMANEEAPTHEGGDGAASRSSSAGDGGGAEKPLTYVPLDEFGRPKSSKSDVSRETDATATAIKTRTTTTLKPIEGTGKLKTRGLSESLEAGAIQSDLSDGFGDLPEFHGADFHKIAADIVEHITNDPHAAMDIAMGDKAAPKGSIPEMYLNILAKQARREGDVETIQRLATQSKLLSGATTMGQRIAALGYKKDVADPVAAIREVQKAREAALAKRHGSLDRAKETISKKINDTMKRTAPSKQTWSQFVDSITC